MPQGTNVINGTEYTTLATKYGDMMAVLDSASTYLYDALVVVAQLNEVEPTRDLIIPFDNVYQQQVQSLTAATPYLEVVRGLNNHVLNRAVDANGTAYTDINDWFGDQTDEGYAVLVPQEWADMCSSTGVTVDAEFII